MAVELSEEQVEQQYIDAMGAELGRLFHCLWKECAWLHLKWNEFVALFGTSAERVDLVNKAAPAFFRLVQDSVWEGILLHICRLTDPPQTMGKDNLTLRRLPPLVLSTLRPKVEQIVEVARLRCEFARDWRKRHIAHRDLGLALGGPAIPLATATKNSVSDALAGVATVLNLIEGHYLNHSAVMYDRMIGGLGNAESLLYVLRDGIEADAARERRLRSGQVLPEDIAPRRSI